MLDTTNIVNLLDSENVPYCFTVLKCMDGIHLNKKSNKYQPYIAAKTVKETLGMDDYFAGYKFWYENAYVPDQNALHTQLVELATQPNKLVILGKLLPEIDPKGIVHRRIKTEGTLYKCFEASPEGRVMAMLDIDKLPVPEGMDIVKDPMGCIMYAISKLPECFHKAQVTAQLSSSAGIKKGIIKLHLWYMFDKPIHSEELIAYANYINASTPIGVGEDGKPLKLLDTSPLNTVQPNYTSNPLFVNADQDPFSNNRIFLINEGGGRVTIPQYTWVVVAKNAAYKKLHEVALLECKTKAENVGYIYSPEFEQELKGLGHSACYELVFDAAMTYGFDVGSDNFNVDALVVRFQQHVAAMDWGKVNYSYTKAYVYEKTTEALLRLQITNAKNKVYSIEKAKKEQKNDYAPYWKAKKSLTTTEASEQLDAGLHKFITELKNRGIQMSAGGGKTSRMAKKFRKLWLELSTKYHIGSDKIDHTKHQFMEIYVSNHQLGYEIAKAFEKDKSGCNVTHIYSRDWDLEDTIEEIENKKRYTEQGNAHLYKAPSEYVPERKMCWYKDEAKKLADANMPISSTLCKVRYYTGSGYDAEALKKLSGEAKVEALKKIIFIKEATKDQKDHGDPIEETCEYYERCGFNKQHLGNYDPINDVWKGGKFDVKIMMHQVLGNSRTYHDREKPFAAVIDETETPSLLVGTDGKYTVSFSEIAESPCSKTFKKLLTITPPTDQPLLKYLRDGLGGKEALLHEVAATLKELDSIKQKVSLTNFPKELMDDAIKILKSNHKVVEFFNKLSVEAKLDRDVLHSVERAYTVVQGMRIYDNSYNLMFRKAVARLDKVPVLKIDASLSEDITRISFPTMEFDHIHVDRDAEFFQITNHKIGKTYLISNLDAEVNNIQNMINWMSEGGKKKILVVGPMLITGNSNPHNFSKALVTIPNNNGYLAHFGAIRGIDAWKDCEVMLIIGNNQPRLDTLERTARALYFDREKPLDLYMPTEKMDEALRMPRTKSQASVGVKTWVHKDPDVQTVLEELLREPEILQSIDRARVIYTNKNAPKKKIYLYLDLVIDETIGTHLTKQDMVKGRNRLTTAFKQFDGVLPINYKWLGDNIPELGKAKDWDNYLNRDLGGTEFANLYMYTMIEDKSKLITYKYKVKGSKGKLCNVLSIYDYDETKHRLTALVGDCYLAEEEE